MNIPKVSILCPCYNRASFVSGLIECIKNQTFKDFEVIIVDDCSVDNTVEQIESLTVNDDRFRIIEKKKNEGPMQARQDGVISAKGKYLFFCDSDDLLPKYALEILYNKMLEKPVNMVVGAGQYINRLGQYSYFRNNISVNTCDEFCCKFFSGYIASSMCGILFDAHWFKSCNLTIVKDLRNNEDSMAMSQLLMNLKSIQLVNESVYIYIQNDNSGALSKLTEKRLRMFLSVQVWILNLLSGNKKYHTLYSAVVLRKIMTLLEQQYNKKILSSFLKENKLSDSSLQRKLLGLKWFVHFTLCKKSSLYGRLMYNIRIYIRRLEHKSV